jgi:hypothetical protein
MQKNCWLDSPAPIDPEHVLLSERTCVVEDGGNISFDGERMFEMGAFQHIHVRHQHNKQGGAIVCLHKGN